MAEPARPFHVANSTPPLNLSGWSFTGDDLCRYSPVGENATWSTERVAEGSEQRVLMRAVPYKVTRDDLFNPLEVHGLVFEFAAAPGTETGFLDFARRFGFLGFPVDVFGEPPEFIGERFSDWQAAHAAIKTAVEMLWSQTQHEPQQAGANDPSTSGQALALNLERINNGLRDSTRMRVMWSESKQRLELRGVPTNLLGAMWWQLARLYSGEVTYTRCKVCGKYMERGPREAGTSARMANAVFCSTTCRSRGHRMRVKAHAMNSAGSAVVDIASHLNTDEATVLEWLSVAS